MKTLRPFAAAALFVLLATYNFAQTGGTGSLPGTTTPNPQANGAGAAATTATPPAQKPPTNSNQPPAGAASSEQKPPANLNAGAAAGAPSPTIVECAIVNKAEVNGKDTEWPNGQPDKWTKSESPACPNSPKGNIDPKAVGRSSGRMGSL